MPSPVPTVLPQIYCIPQNRPIRFEHRKLFLQICKPGDDGAVHWMIFMKRPGVDRGIRLHSIGYKGNRTLVIEDNKRFDSHLVKHTHLLGILYEADVDIVLAEAEKIPPQNCKLWACYLMLRIGRKGLLPPGAYNHFIADYRHSFDEDYGPGPDPDHPFHYH